MKTGWPRVAGPPYFVYSKVVVGVVVKGFALSADWRIEKSW